MNDFVVILDKMDSDDAAHFVLAWRIMKELESCREFLALANDPSGSERMFPFIEDMWEREVPFTHHMPINRQRFFQAAAESVHISAVFIEEDRQKAMRSRLRKMGYKHMPILPADENDISRVITEAISRYEKQDPAKATLQKLKFYLHMSMAEIAELYERSETDVKAKFETVITDIAKLMKQVAEEGEEPLRKPRQKKGKRR